MRDTYNIHRITLNFHYCEQIALVEPRIEASSQIQLIFPESTRVSRNAHRLKAGQSLMRDTSGTERAAYQRCGEPVKGT